MTLKFGSALHGTLALAILVLAASGSGSARAADLIRVGTPSADDFHFSMANVGVDAGIFKKEGIELQIVALAGGAKLHQAMTAGSLDVALGAGHRYRPRRQGRAGERDWRLGDQALEHGVAGEHAQRRHPDRGHEG